MTVFLIRILINGGAEMIKRYPRNALCASTANRRSTHATRRNSVGMKQKSARTGEAPMSNPSDIARERVKWLEVTGLAPKYIGISADPKHLLSGGYHCGALELRSINAIARNDYSIRQPGDRRRYLFDLEQGNDHASASDIGSPWPNGGRAAWVRFNELLRSRLGAREPRLSAVRGINYTNTAGAVRRFDCLTGAESSSTDRDHTHIEFWRNTIGTAERAQTLDWITQTMITARDQTGDGDMDDAQAAKLNDVHYTLTTGNYGPEHARWATAMPMLEMILKNQGVAQSDIDDIQARTGVITLTDAQVAILAEKLEITPEALKTAARAAVNAALDDDAST